MRPLYLLAALALLTGCATSEQRAWTTVETTYHVLNAVDMAQSIDGISNDCGYYEQDPVTRPLLGSQPTSSEFVAYGALWSLAFHVFNRLEWVQEHPRVRGAVDAVAILWKVYDVAGNEQIGIKLGARNTWSCK